ncbi:MAG: AbrB family transcriptional regulator, partial [Pseudomonadota bacterium]
LTAAGAIGFLGGRRLGLPAAVITGPILASGALHLAGITEAMPPAFLIALTQFVVGLGLGVRFVGMARGPAMRGLGMAALSVGAAILLALAIGGALHGIVRETAEAVVLAFAPGGVTEMSLVALSLQISVVFVSAHHVVRILLCVFFAKIGHNWLVRHRGWSDGGQASSTS